MRRCPVCSAFLFRRIVAGIEADGCQNCGGVWLDDGELKSLAASREYLLALDRAFTPLGQPQNLSSSQRICPECAVPLQTAEFDRFRGIPLGFCEKCNGLWIDRGKIPAIADRLFPQIDAVQGTAQEIFPQEQTLQPADTDSPLTCPVCGDNLTAKSIGSFLIQGCGGCGGIFMESGILENFAARPQSLTYLESAFRPSSIPLDSGKDKPCRCPACGKNMTAGQYQETGVRIDYCAGCGGTWLNNGAAFSIAERLAAAEPKEMVPQNQSAGLQIPGSASSSHSAPTSSGINAWQTEKVPICAPGIFDNGYQSVPQSTLLQSNLLTSIETEPSIRISQKRDFLEHFIGFEQRNTYYINGSEGKSLGMINECSGGTLFRLLLGHGCWRTYDLMVKDNRGYTAFCIHHPFAPIFHRFYITGNSGQKIGCIKQRFSPLFRCFDIFDANGTHALSISAPVWHPWTFKLYRPGESEPLSVIYKRWPGFFAFFYSDADNFEIFFSQKMTPEERYLVFCSALAVDLTYFEKNGGN